MDIRSFSMISVRWPQSVILDWARVPLPRGTIYQLEAQGKAEFDRWATNAGRAGGTGKHKGKRHSVGHLRSHPRGRMRAISKTMSRELRHEPNDSLQRDGFVPLNDLLNTEDLRELFASREDIRRIVRGGGGNNKFRFEMAMLADRATVTFREAQGHIASSGVSGDISPVAEDLVTLIPGATLTEVKSIVCEGISRVGRLRVHFYESGLEGRPTEAAPPVRLTSEAIIVASAEVWALRIVLLPCI